jgi:hypothetical protein
MGDIPMFQRYFHEIFVRGVLNEYVPAHREGSMLSKRERECLTMSARGLTGEDIAIKLSRSACVLFNITSIRYTASCRVAAPSLLRIATRREAAR